MAAIFSETKSTNDPKQPASHQGGKEQQGHQAQQGPTGRAAGTGTLVLSNSSISPGPLWYEFSSSAALALTVGANTMTANLPVNGAAYLQPYFDRPLLSVAYPGPAVPFVPDEATLPVPQSTKKILGSTASAMPAGASITNVTYAAGPPATVTININATAAASLPAGTRFLVFTIQGV